MDQDEEGEGDSGAEGVDGDASLQGEGAIADPEGEEEEGAFRGEEVDQEDGCACVRREGGEVEGGSWSGSVVGGVQMSAWKEEGEEDVETEVVDCERKGEEGEGVGRSVDFS